MVPNFFTSEYSCLPEESFLRWFLKWAIESNKNIKPNLHASAKSDRQTIDAGQYKNDGDRHHLANSKLPVNRLSKKSDIMSEPDIVQRQYGRKKDGNPRPQTGD